MLRKQQETMSQDLKEVKKKSLSHVRLFVTPWTVAHQASLSMEFSRQEYWSGLPFPSPGDRPHPGITPISLTSPALASHVLLPLAAPGKAQLASISAPKSSQSFSKLYVYINIPILLIKNLSPGKTM